MSAEDRILFACARQELRPEDRARIEAIGREQPVRWEAVAATAERHGVAPIVGVSLARCDAAALSVPPEISERFELALFENAAQKEHEGERVAAALAHLAEVGFEVMLLKGAALELEVYDGPWVAASRDTDLVLRFRPGFGPGPEEKRIRLALYRSGIECDLDEHHDVTMNGVLPVPFERIWADSRPARFRGQEVRVMSPEDLLISLCINSGRKRFFRLKGLFDIAETVRRCAGLDWARFAAKAKAYRCEGVVYTALFAAGETLGFGPPAHRGAPLAELGVHPLRARALRALVRGFLRTASLASLAGDAGARSAGLSVLLPYASLRWGQGWRSLRYTLTHPPVHRPPAFEPAVAAAGSERPG